jgi:hypothetical protein
MADTVLKGLAAIQQELAKRPQSGDFEDKPKARYVNVDSGGSIKITPLQEIDEGSPNYLADNGLAVFVLMHSNPDNWKKSAKCTADLGDCYGCKHGWRQKVLLFLNVLVDDGNEDPYVAIFNRGLGKGSVAQALLDMAADDDFNMSITDKTFKFTRTGSKKDTTYSLSPLPKAHGLDLASFKDDLYDLEKYVFTVSPERQEAYYLDGQVADEAPAGERQKVGAGSVEPDAEW